MNEQTEGKPAPPRPLWIVLNAANFPVAVFADKDKAEHQARTLTNIPPGMMSYRVVVAFEASVLTELLVKTACTAIDSWSKLREGMV